MKKKKELAMYQHEFEIYKAELTCGDGEKRKIRKALADFMIILAEHGRTWPEPSDYDEYSEHSTCNESETTQNVKRIKRFFTWLEKEHTPMTDKTIQQEIPLDEPDSVQQVDTAQLLNEPSQVVNEPTTQQDFSPSQATDNTQEFSQGAGLDDGAITENSQPEISHDVPSITENEKPVNGKNGAKRKPGRVPLDTVNGESKSEKLMMYFTPTLLRDIRAWCDLKGISCVGYITALIEADITTHKDKIDFFLKLRGNA